MQAKAGTKAALDGLQDRARRPREMARVATLAEKKGGKTRAILKTLGRGAIMLTIASFNLAAWMLGAMLTAVRLRLLGQERGRADDPAHDRPRQAPRSMERRMQPRFASD